MKNMWNNSVFYYDKEFQTKFDELMKIVIDMSHRLYTEADGNINDEQKYRLLNQIKAIYGDCVNTPMADI